MQNEYKTSLPELLDGLVGPYKNIYTGYACDTELRYQSSSGGIATALLSYMLDNGRIEGALIAVPVPETPIRHRIYKVESAEGVKANKGTVYCTVDHSHAWRFLRDKDSRLAVVGEPCFLKAVDLFIESE